MNASTHSFTCWFIHTIHRVSAVYLQNRFPLESGVTDMVLKYKGTINRQGRKNILDGMSDIRKINYALGCGVNFVSLRRAFLKGD